jgi:hypothetical protein
MATALVLGVYKSSKPLGLCLRIGRATAAAEVVSCRFLGAI